MSKRKPLMEVLIATFNEKDKGIVSSLIKNYTNYSLSLQSFGSLDSNDSFWNFEVIQQCSLVALIPANKTKEILIQLETNLNLNEKHQGIAFTVPLDSADASLVEKLWQLLKNNICVSPKLNMTLKMVKK